MKVINYSTFRSNLANILDQVVNDVDKAFVTRPNNKTVVVMSMEEYNQIEETLYLLSTQANVDSIARSLRQHSEGLVHSWEDIKHEFQPIKTKKNKTQDENRAHTI